MAFLRTLVRSVAFVGLGAAWLQAQTTHARVLVAPQGQPRIAAIAPPPSPPRPSSFEETVFVSNDVFVLPDGRVFIDLGNSYEQVARICPRVALAAAGHERIVNVIKHRFAAAAETREQEGRLRCADGVG